MTGAEFEAIDPTNSTIRVQALRDWILGKWTVLEAQQTTLEGAPTETPGSDLVVGLEIAAVGGKIELLRELEADFVQPHAEGS